MNHKCPLCGAVGADILLNKVFCPNEQCQWFDQETLNRLIVPPKTYHVFGITDPDKTPTWHPLGDPHEDDD